jgi:hypothetical protein
MFCSDDVISGCDLAPTSPTVNHVHVGLVGEAGAKSHQCTDIAHTMSTPEQQLPVPVMHLGPI